MMLWSVNTMVTLYTVTMWTFLQEMMRRIIVALSAVLILVFVLYRCGILRRLLQRFAEYELSKEINGARVTIGNLEVDFRNGDVLVRDLIVHSPQRDLWQWDSPLLARAGLIKASLNILSFADQKPIKISRYLGYPCREVYSVRVEDIQVFVEKRHNVFNFHLMDDSLDIPDPVKVMDKYHQNNQQQNQNQNQQSFLADQNNNDSCGLETIPSEDSAAQPSSDGIMSTPQHQHTNSSTSAVTDPSAEKKANDIVFSMLGAVSSLGRAVNEGGKEGFEKALGIQKEGVLNTLKKFQQQQRSSTEATSIPPPLSSMSSSSSSLSANNHHNNQASATQATTTVQTLAMEGMKVMKQMGKAVGKNVSEIQEQIDSYKKPPPKKKGWIKKESKDVFRIGWIVLVDFHIFTKNLILMPDSSNNSTATMSSPQKGGSSSSHGSSNHNTSHTETAGKDVLQSYRTNDSTTKNDNTNHRCSNNKETNNVNTRINSIRPPGRPLNAAGWSPPILLKLVTMTSSDLCPSTSHNISSNEPPCIGLKIDAIQDILIQRMLAELAKSNTGNVLRMALGDVFAWMQHKGSSSNSGGGGGVGGSSRNKRRVPS